jgi:hypothetical protein
MREVAQCAEARPDKLQQILHRTKKELFEKYSLECKRNQGLECLIGCCLHGCMYPDYYYLLNFTYVCCEQYADMILFN